MLVYILTGLLTFLCLRNYENVDCDIKKHNKYLKLFYKIFAILVLTLIYGFRDYSVGTDTQTYNGMFKWLGSTFDFDKFIYEKGFCLLNVLVNKIFGSFTALLLIEGFIIYFCVVNIFCEMSEKPSISILCYFGLGSFAQSCNATRQYIAISFCIVALYYLMKKKKPILFVLFIVLACLFHKSAIVFLIILPLKFLKFNRNSAIAIICLTILSIPIMPYLVKIFDNIFKTGYSYYIKTNEGISLINICILVVSIISLGIVIKYRKYVYQDNNALVYYDNYAKMLLLFVCLMIYSVFVVELVDRIALYFLISVYFLVPMILNHIKNYKAKFYSYILTILFILLMFYLLADRGSYGVIPYKFV